MAADSRGWLKKVGLGWPGTSDKDEMQAASYRATWARWCEFVHPPRDRPAVDVVVVDPDPDALEIIQRSFEDSQAHPRLRVEPTHETALESLQARKNTRPTLVVVDLDDDEEMGVTLIGKIKGDAGLKHIPVVALTTGRNDGSVSRAYDAQVNSCIFKGSTVQGLEKQMRSLASFWLTVAKLPPGHA